MSPIYNQTSNTSPTRMSAKLLNYFNHQILRSVEPVDAVQFDLLDFDEKINEDIQLFMRL